MPVPQGLADVDAVADARRELLGARQVGADDRLGLIAHVAMEALDPVVLRRIGAHSERVPPLPPPRLLLLLRGLGRSSQVRHEIAWPGSRLTIGPVPQTGSSARLIPIRARSGLIEVRALPTDRPRR